MPLNIIRRKGTRLDRTNPVRLSGYGSYGDSVNPTFGGSTMEWSSGSTLRLWLDAGGVFVETNLRGGGEYGEEWHVTAMLTHKQNLFDDFLACAQYDPFREC